MFSVLLFILKIIGIILLSVLGLLIVSLLVVLLVPLRYRLYGKMQEEIKADCKLSWLCHFVTIRILYDGDKPVIYGRILGIKLFDSSKPKQRKEKKQKKSKKRKKGSEEEIRIDLPTEESNTELVNLQPLKAIETEEPSHSETKEDVDQENKTRHGFRMRLLAILQRIADLVEKVLLGLKNLKEKLAGFVDMAVNIFHKIGIVKAFLADSRNKLAFREAFTGLKKILAHIMPYKIKGYVAFGTGDPYTMGQVLTALGIIYGKFGKSLEIRPDYEEKCFEAELMMRGRIRTGTLLKIVWRLWRNTDIRYLRQGFRDLREELKRESQLAA